MMIPNKILKAQITVALCPLLQSFQNSCFPIPEWDDLGIQAHKFFVMLFKTAELKTCML